MSVAEFRLRVAEAPDIAAVVALERAVKEAPHWTEEVYAAMLGGATDAGLQRLLVIAEDAAGALVGFAVGRLLRLGEAVEAELESVVVAEIMRRRGLGRTLCEAVIAWVKEQGGKTMELEVRASNRSAIVLYETLGFKIGGVRKVYYRHPTEDATLMTLQLL